MSGARVLVWRITFAGTQATAEAAAEPFVHGGDVCSVDWDFTGTRLAAAALDGRVRCVVVRSRLAGGGLTCSACRLWTANLLGEWGEYTG